MKFYKILFFFLLFLLMFIPISKCDFETSDIDINTIGDNYNNNSYVAALANIGVKVTATQSNNVIVLTYNDSDSLIYTYNESDGVFSTSYSSLNNEHLDILNAIFIDTISTMQGNASGVQLSAAFDDSFCFSTLKDNGISKNYLSDDGSSITVDFKINPSIKLPVPQIDSSIKEEDFYKEYETLYEKETTIVKAQGLLFLKSYDENGNLFNEGHRFFLVKMHLKYSGKTTSKIQFTSPIICKYPDGTYYSLGLLGFIDRALSENSTCHLTLNPDDEFDAWFLYEASRYSHDKTYYLRGSFQNYIDDDSYTGYLVELNDIEDVE